MAVLPPPNITRRAVEAFAYCGDSMCQGNGTQPVRAVSTLFEWTFASRGGDGLFAAVVENSNTELRFAGTEEGDESLSRDWEDGVWPDVSCRFCGKSRSLSPETRPDIPRMSGFPQNGLLNVKDFDPSVRNTAADEAAAAVAARQALEMEDLKTQMAVQGAQMQALLEQLGGAPDQAPGPEAPPA
jgi:hypothetical protein